MKDKQYKRILCVKTFLLQLAIAFAFLFGNTTCSKPNEPDDKFVLRDNLMVVYPNSGNVFTLVDYKTFEVVSTITVNVPDNLQIQRMCLSTNKDYFVFVASSGSPDYLVYVITYKIAKGIIEGIFPTGLDHMGAPRLTAAYKPDEPGLIYFYSHLNGLYSFDFLTKQVNLISTEKNIDKHFYFSFNKEVTTILRLFDGDISYSEIEFYNTVSGLNNKIFILNQSNCDSIYVDDLAFSKDNSELFVSIRMPKMRGIGNYFGSYNLTIKKLYKSSITFPWSLNPYYIAYSSKRNEVYTVGAQNKFYIIEINAKDYKINSVIDLIGKIQGASRILITPDEKFAFVSAADSNLVFVIDLDNREIVQKIEVKHPYLMLLLS